MPDKIVPEFVVNASRKCAQGLLVGLLGTVCLLAKVALSWPPQNDKNRQKHQKHLWARDRLPTAKTDERI